MSPHRVPHAALTRVAADQIAAAKLWLIATESPTTCGDMPYLATALYALTIVPTPAVQRINVDTHWRAYINPTWIGRTDIDHIGLELAHHVWHLLADHAARAADLGVNRATAEHWRAASDATITDVLPWPLPHLAIPAQLGLPPERSAEQYFAALSGLPATDPSPEPESVGDPDTGDIPDSSCGSGCDGIPRFYELPATDPDNPTVGTHAAEAIRRKVAIEFRDHQRRHGTTPGEWQRWVDQILDPIVPWQQVLRSAVRRGLGWAHGHTDYTYTRISRRQPATNGIILPALRRPVPVIAIVVDTSGSIDDGLLAQALGEVDAVLTAQAVPTGAVTVLAVDAAVHTVNRVRDVGAIVLAGGGGTDMTLGITAASALKPTPHLIIVLTDGYTDWPTTPNIVPVIVGLLGRTRDQLPDIPDWVQRIAIVPAD